MSPSKEDAFKGSENPSVAANYSVDPPLFCNLYFSHLNGLLKLGNDRQLNPDDLGVLPAEVDPLHCYERFREAWSSELKTKTDGNYSLYSTTLKVVGAWKIIFIAVVSSLSGNAMFAVPLLQEAIVKSQDGTRVLSTAVLWVLITLTLIIPVLTTITVSRAQSKRAYYDLQMQSALRMAIHAKILTVGPIAQKQYSIGEITTLFQRDVMTASGLTAAICSLCTQPVQVFVGLLLVYNIFGVATLACLGIIVFNAVASFYLARKQMVAFRDYQKHSAKRLKIMSEVLVGIRGIKYNSWEQAFLSSIQSMRIFELGKLLKYQSLQMPANVLGVLSPVCMPIVVFYTYIRQGNSMSFVQAFTTLMIFERIVSALKELPSTLSTVIEAMESLKRIGRFLTSPDLQDYVDTTTEGELAGAKAGGDSVVFINDASLGWDHRQTTGELEHGSESESGPATSATAADGEGGGEVALIDKKRKADNNDDSDLSNRSINTLQGVQLAIERGQLVAVVGSVGAGKSSLLLALLGEMVIHPVTSDHDNNGKGDKDGEIKKVRLLGEVAYHQQQPWIFNATLRENILFGRAYDPERFGRVVQCCALQADIDSIPHGIETEIGERGINLSGGQKARVSFARALYRDADVYLLDDPLSAVDARVAHTMVHEALLQDLRARGKTVVLVTHQVHILSLFDVVVVVKDGKVAYQGPPDGVTPGLLPSSVEGDSSPAAANAANAAGKVALEAPPAPPPANATAIATPAVVAASAPSVKKRGEGGGKRLMTSERRSSGSIDLSVYLYYLRGGGLGLFTVVLLMLAGEVIFSTLANYSIISWSSAEEESSSGLSSARNMHYVNLYSMFALIEVLCFAVMWLLRILITQTGARFFHYHLAEVMLNAPVSFYDTTPLGRILTLFSNDLRSMNVMLFAMVEKTCHLGLKALGSVIVISEATSGAFLVIALPLALVVYKCQLYYRATNTEVSRLSARSYSPIMVEFAQQLGSLPSLRAYHAFPDCVQAMRAKIAAYNTATFMKQNIKLWLLMRLETMGSTIVFFCIVAQVVTRGYISPADLSIAVLYAQTLPSLSQSFLAMSSQLEASMASAERFKMAVDTTPQEGTTLRDPMYTLGAVPVKDKDVTDDIDTNVEGAKPIMTQQELSRRGQGYGRDRDSVLRRAGGLVLRDWLCCWCAGDESKRPGLEWWSDLAEGDHGDCLIPPASWPERGVMEVSDLQMRYRDGPLVLQGLTFSVEAGQKIGIVGRTGSGKSSMGVALFGIEKPCGGSIIIDGIDTARVPLGLLRARLGVVMQESVLFSNTLRFNIDPFRQHSDADILAALRAVGLGGLMEGLQPAGLDSRVEEGGGNFSQGQRQLITFCRALLKAPTLLLLDEATASLDNDSDDKVQALLSQHMAGRTQLTIAHRLGSVREADRVMVMHNGKAGEFGKPDELLQEPQQGQGQGNSTAKGNNKGMFRDLWIQHQTSRSGHE